MIKREVQRRSLPASFPVSWECRLKGAQSIMKTGKSSWFQKDVHSFILCKSFVLCHIVFKRSVLAVHGDIFIFKVINTGDVLHFSVVFRASVGFVLHGPRGQCLKSY